jgi:DNA-binding NtrC family response regulator
MTMPRKEIIAKGEKIAVVWDDRDQVDILVMLLKACGYVANGFICGEDALSHMRLNDVDLLLLDTDVGKNMNALKTYKRAKKLCSAQKAILMSACGEAPGRGITKSGINRIIAKPFTVRYLAREISEVLGNLSDRGGDSALPRVH